MSSFLYSCKVAESLVKKVFTNRNCALQLCSNIAKAEATENPHMIAAAALDGGNIVGQRNVSDLGKCKEKTLKTHVFEFSNN